MRSLLAGLCFGALACSATQTDGENPFTQNMDDPGKEDSAYMNPDGVEVEVDIEGDVIGPDFQLADAPAALGQYALTYFRKKEMMYIESLAEDASTQDRAEWLV